MGQETRILFIADSRTTHWELSVWHALGAAHALGSVVWMVYGAADGAGSDRAALVQQAAQAPVEAVLDVQLPQGAGHAPEILAVTVKDMLQQWGPFDAIVAPTDAIGQHLLPRLAGMLGVDMISRGIQYVGMGNAGPIWERAIYAGHLVEQVALTTRPWIISVSPPHFAAPSWRLAGDPAPVYPVAWTHSVPSHAQWMGYTPGLHQRPPLQSARVVVAGGRSLGTPANFQMVVELADALGAAVGGTRAAVEAGLIDNRYQIGQTGTTIAPALYIAVGISGAPQHIAGILGSQKIVAINSDPQAPIFQVADHPIVGDMFTWVPQWIAALRSRSGGTDR